MKKTLYLLLLIISGNIYSQCSHSDYFNYVEIPDANFEKAIIDYLYPGTVGTINDRRRISICEAKEVTKLILVDKNISSIEGIEFFENLERFSISGNNITNIDLSKNTKLNYFIGNSNSLTSLDLSENKDLLYVNVNRNRLTSLELNNPLLSYLDISYNNIIDIDLSKSVELRKFEAAENKIESLDLRNNTILRELTVPRNNLTGKLDLSFCPVLYSIYLGPTSLTKIKMINQTILNTFLIGHSPNLESICVDTDLIPMVTLALDRGGVNNVDVSDTCENFSNRSQFSDYFTLFPNPTYGVMKLERLDADPLLVGAAATITDTNGTFITEVPLSYEGNANLPNPSSPAGVIDLYSVDVSNLPSGIFIITILSHKGNLSSQFIKR